ncbi:MAG: hypothetical protein FWH35_02180 [Treponema sp.]|nr:hypothetical protein [Treponema sp.]
MKNYDIYPVNKGNNMETDIILYNAVCSNSVTLVKEAFDLGAVPDYCKGDAGWYDSNPLGVLIQNLLDSYYDFGELTLYAHDDHRDLVISNIGVLNLLLSHGADIHRRPYIWHIVFLWGNDRIKDIKATGDEFGHTRTEDEINRHINIFIRDTNILLENYVNNGADPDMLGHPYPFSYEAIRTRITDEQANEYFAQGTRAINIAIEKGIVWESQVDLLLKYTNLDEESLKAAERSSDSAMVEKIQKLWNEQKEKH